MAVVGRRSSGVLGFDLEVLRHSRILATNEDSRQTHDAGRRVVSRGDTQLCRSGVPSSHPRTPGPHRGERSGRIDAARLGRSRTKGCESRSSIARHGTSTRRSGGGIHAERPRDDHRLPSRCKPRGNVVAVFARYGPGERTRSLQADLAEGHVRGRWLSVWRKILRSSRSRGRIAARLADAREIGARTESRCECAGERISKCRRLGRAPDRQRKARGRACPL